MTKIGDRVGALLKGDGDTVWLFGYGIFQGYVIPDSALGVTFLGVAMEHPNPCILLDSGKQVFGCECWWGPETEIQKRLAAYTTVIDVDIQEQRRLHADGVRGS